jgi:hypothetical protein
MNKALCDEVIDYLTTWKEAFLNGSDWSFEKGLGIECITDSLDGISEKGHSCFASYLFSQLNDKEKEYILNSLDDDFLQVNFDKLESVYYI